MNKEELQVVLELHKKWLNNEEGGKRANLRGASLSCANLRYADLRYADLSGANLRYADLRYADLPGADLRGADLRGADLSGADLRGAKIYNTIGDGVFIRSMQLPKYIVNICDDWLQIGCQGHRVHEWAEFTDAEISEMEVGALEWWNGYRDLVVTFADWKGYVKC